jgi:hypothetical protein
VLQILECLPPKSESLRNPISVLTREMVADVLPSLQRRRRIRNPIPASREIVADPLPKH